MQFFIRSHPLKKILLVNSKGLSSTIGMLIWYIYYIWIDTIEICLLHWNSLASNLRIRRWTPPHFVHVCSGVLDSCWTPLWNSISTTLVLNAYQNSAKWLSMTLCATSEKDPTNNDCFHRAQANQMDKQSSDWNSKSFNITYLYIQPGLAL